MLNRSGSPTRGVERSRSRNSTEDTRSQSRIRSFAVVAGAASVSVRGAAVNLFLSKERELRFPFDGVLSSSVTSIEGTTKSFSERQQFEVSPSKSPSQEQSASTIAALSSAAWRNLLEPLMYDISLGRSASVLVLGDSSSAIRLGCGAQEESIEHPSSDMYVDASATTLIAAVSAALLNKLPLDNDEPLDALNDRKPVDITDLRGSHKAVFVNARRQPVVSQSNALQLANKAAATCKWRRGVPRSHLIFRFTTQHSLVDAGFDIDAAAQQDLDLPTFDIIIAAPYARRLELSHVDPYSLEQRSINAAISNLTYMIDSQLGRSPPSGSNWKTFCLTRILRSPIVSTRLMTLAVIPAAASLHANLVSLTLASALRQVHQQESSGSLVQISSLSEAQRRLNILGALHRLLHSASPSHSDEVLVMQAVSDAAGTVSLSASPVRGTSVSPFRTTTPTKEISTPSASRTPLRSSQTASSRSLRSSPSTPLVTRGSFQKLSVQPSPKSSAAKSTSISKRPSSAPSPSATIRGRPSGRTSSPSPGPSSISRTGKSPIPKLNMRAVLAFEDEEKHEQKSVTKPALKKTSSVPSRASSQPTIVVKAASPEPRKPIIVHRLNPVRSTISKSPEPQTRSQSSSLTFATTPVEFVSMHVHHHAHHENPTASPIRRSSSPTKSVSPQPRIVIEEENEEQSSSIMSPYSEIKFLQHQLNSRDVVIDRLTGRLASYEERWKKTNQDFGQLLGRIEELKPTPVKEPGTAKQEASETPAREGSTVRFAPTQTTSSPMSESLLFADKIAQKSGSPSPLMNAKLAPCDPPSMEEGYEDSDEPLGRPSAALSASIVNKSQLQEVVADWKAVVEATRLEVTQESRVLLDRIEQAAQLGTPQLVQAVEGSHKSLSQSIASLSTVLSIPSAATFTGAHVEGISVGILNQWTEVIRSALVSACTAACHQMRDTLGELRSSINPDLAADLEDRLALFTNEISIAEQQQSVHIGMLLSLVHSLRTMFDDSVSLTHWFSSNGVATPNPSPWSKRSTPAAHTQLSRSSAYNTRSPYSGSPVVRNSSSSWQHQQQQYQHDSSTEAGSSPETQTFAITTNISSIQSTSQVPPLRLSATQSFEFDTEILTPNRAKFDSQAAYEEAVRLSREFILSVIQKPLPPKNIKL